MSQKLNELYDQILSELETCDTKTTPTICSNLETEESRSCIVNTIAEYVLIKHLTITQAIIEVEKTYSENGLD
jgi:hypothetical protein